MATAELTRLERDFVPTTSFSDVLSELTERERVASAQAVACRPEPVARRIPVQSRGVPVLFQFLDNGCPRPDWFMPVLKGFANLATLSDNWDGEGAPRIDRDTMNRALAAIERLLACDAKAPSIVPLAHAGLQIEWHRNGKDLEIEFSPSGRVEFYYYDEETGDEHEGPVGTNFGNVREYMQRVW